MPDAGWYRDPQDPSAEEYWDGHAWSGVRRPSSDGWGQRPSYPQQQPFGMPPAPGPGHEVLAYGPPPGRRRRRRTLLIVAAAVVVVVAAAGVVTVVLRSGSTPKITFAGKEIASPDTPLTRAGRAVDALVSKEHGVRSRSTRCYYAKPATPAKGRKASDVLDSLRCGPVLFVDGDRAREYLTVPLDADTSGSRAELTAETSSLGSDSPAAVPSGLTLVRPDDATAPKGNGGLSVPEPPPAAKDLTIATSLTAAEAPTSDVDSMMASKKQAVTLQGAGYIQRYGSGADARSAPDGQRLLAFKYTTGTGALGTGGPSPTLVVDGTSRDLPDASDGDWVVAAVPTGSDPVLQLSADGYTQTLSLPAGKAGAGNIAVLARTSTTSFIGTNFTMHSTLSANGASENEKLSVEITGASLYFWPSVHPGAHPASTSSAFLSVNATYTTPSEAGKTIGYNPGLIRLELPGGRTVHAQNLAGKDKIYDVFTVPASYTTGTLVIEGSADIGHGTKQTLQETKRITVSIP